MQDESEVRLRDQVLFLERVERTILRTVTNSTGIKGVDLVLKVMEDIGPGKFQQEEYHVLLQSLVDRSEIIELEYEVPHTKYKTKSIYFPKGTTFRLMSL